MKTIFRFNIRPIEVAEFKVLIGHGNLKISHCRIGVAKICLTCRNNRERSPPSCPNLMDQSRNSLYWEARKSMAGIKKSAEIAECRFFNGHDNLQMIHLQNRRGKNLCDL